MKKCFKCQVLKPLEEFYKHAKMADGHLGKCKECTKLDMKIRFNDPERKPARLEYEIIRNRKPERKAKLIEYQRRKRAKNPERYKARQAVSNAIRDGKISRKPCEVCGAKAEAHHADYRYPLAVRWLCFAHHRKIAHNQSTF